MGLRLFLTAILLATQPSKFLFAELVPVGDYYSHEPLDRKVHFALALTPEQDVLSFVAKANGIWRITRIHGWLEKTPAEQTIDIPGWPAKKTSKGGSEFLTEVGASLVITLDGKHVSHIVFTDPLSTFWSGKSDSFSGSRGHSSKTWKS